MREKFLNHFVLFLFCFTELACLLYPLFPESDHRQKDTDNELLFYTIQQECTIIHRSYMQAFFNNQMNSVEPQSEFDVFQAFSDRLTPEIRMEALQDQLEEFETVINEYEGSCIADDAVFTPDENPDEDIEEGWLSKIK